MPDQSVDEIHCRSVLEHIENFENRMRRKGIDNRAAQQGLNPHILKLIPVHQQLFGYPFR